MSDSLQPHELEPARLLCPWDFPGKNTGEGSHFLLQGIFLAQTESEPVSPAWAGRFSTTASPGRPNDSHTHTHPATLPWAPISPSFEERILDKGAPAEGLEAPLIENLGRCQPSFPSRW